MRSALLAAGFAVLAALTASGCGQKTPPTLDEKTVEATEQIRKVGTAYMKAHQAKRRSPTAEELKPYLKQHGDPDKLLTSPRDGKPWVIVPGFSPDVEM